MLILDNACSTPALNNIIMLIKNIFNLITIIAPILLIISLLIIFTRLVVNPEEKKGLKKVFNSCFALVFIFFMPMIVNIVMYICGSTFTFSDCWNSVNKKIGEPSTYLDIYGRKKNKLFDDPEKYEHGEKRNLDFNCKSSVLKTKFSCETQKIVEEHYKDFNYNNFRSYTASQGGADAYIKNLGGVFTEYYGKKPHVTTVEEFQKVSEYVFGLMYIYGFDYYNGSKYCKWGGSCGGNTAASDAFYPGSMKHTNEGLSNRKDFDALITGKGKVNMTTNCNWTVDMVYIKAGLNNSTYGSGTNFVSQCTKGQNIKNVEDFKVGDIIHFFKSPINKNNPASWKGSGWYHVAYVGEVYDDKVVFYDGGSYFTNNMNYKWEAKRSNSTTTLHGTKNWGVCRAVDLQ